MKTCVATTKADCFDLKYFKTCTKVEDNGTEGSFYGVSVEKYTDDLLIEEMDSGPLSDSNTLITDIINQLAQGSVTPFALCQVLDEIDVLY